MTDPRDSQAPTGVMSEAKLRGRFLWHELMTTDTRAAAEFYTRIVGWTMQSWDQNPTYQMFVAGGVPMAGLMTLPDDARQMGAPPGWLGYIGTPDVDATARLAVKLGGRVLKEAMQIPAVGRFVVLQDPHRGVFAAYTPEQDPVGDERATLGDFSWHELATTDPESAFAFYHELFGWEKTDAMDMGPGMGVYQMFGARGQTLGGIYRIPSGAPQPPAWLAYALVTSSERVAGLVPKLGGQVINGPMDVPGGDQIVQITDPQGGMFAVHSKGTAKGTAAGNPKSVAGEGRKSRARAARPKRGVAGQAKRTAGRRTAARKAKPKRASRKRASRKRAARAASQRRGAVKAKVRSGKRTKKSAGRSSSRRRR